MKNKNMVMAFMFSALIFNTVKAVESKNEVKLIDPKDQKIIDRAKNKIEQVRAEDAARKEKFEQYVEANKKFEDSQIKKLEKKRLKQKAAAEAKAAAAAKKLPRLDQRWTESDFAAAKAQTAKLPGLDQGWTDLDFAAAKAEAKAAADKAAAAQRANEVIAQKESEKGVSAMKEMVRLKPTPKESFEKLQAELVTEE